MEPSALSLKLADHGRYGISPHIKKVNRTSVDQKIDPVVPLKHEYLENKYNQLSLTFSSRYELTFRAYEEGIAYRFSLSHTDSVDIEDEEVTYRFAGDYRILYPEERSLQSHYERLYVDTTLSGLERGSFCSLPTTLQTPDGITMVISDTDIYDYPHLFLEARGQRTLQGKFPQKVLETESTSDRNEKIIRKSPDIAESKGTRPLPWRSIKIEQNASELLENTLFYKLARPGQLADTDWIRPGKVAWDWWNALNLFDVSFKAGLNTETYKYYIDFASDYGLEYVILDEGWSNTTDLQEVNPEIDLPELVRYANQKEVGLILWMLWKPLKGNIDHYFSLFEEWGIRGLKIDFMQRADQDMVQFYERVAETAAEHHLLVNFHGSFKPSGLRRAYPNVLTYEGVKGLENSKWNSTITPSHDVVLPFTRMTAGPMDFTPGAMVNAHTDNFRSIYTRPMSQGTRAHQVAMYILYESGLQMLADSPSHYREEPRTTRFISRIPVTWHETIALKSEIGEYLVLARRHNEKWYIAAMTGSEQQSIQVDLSFLHKETSYKATIFKDGVNAGRYAEDFEVIENEVQKGDTLTLDMVQGGGWSAILNPGP